MIGAAQDLNFVHTFTDHLLEPFLVLLQEMALDHVPGRSVSVHPRSPRFSVGFLLHLPLVRHASVEKVFINSVTLYQEARKVLAPSRRPRFHSPFRLDGGSLA